MPTWWNGRHKRLKISGLNRPCRFESGRGYQILASFAFKVKHTWLISRKRELKRGQKGTLLGQKRVSADAGPINELYSANLPQIKPLYSPSVSEVDAYSDVSADIRREIKSHQD